MQDIIVVNQLTKKYGDFTAVKGMSFSVRQGEIFGILGPNGAGKTTTLEMIEGLTSITSGVVYIDGYNVERETRLIKSLIGVQLQSSAFFEGLNLMELIDLFAAMYGRTVNALKLLDDVQLTDKAKSQVKELSGGQKQRLSIAVALVNDPKILFLDEPTTGLDPQARRNLWDLITNINKTGKTIVLTTHYLEEAEILCDHVAIMDHAEIIALDTPQNLIVGTGVNSTIYFRSLGNVSYEQLMRLPEVVHVDQEGTQFRIISNNPQVTLPVLFSVLGRDILDLELKNPTLEDVFLKLTGHALRE